MNNRGFTLTETIIYTGLFAMIIASMSAFSWQIIALKNKNDSMREVNDSAQTAMRLIRQRIISADELIAPRGGSTGDYLRLSSSAGEAIIGIDNGRLAITQNGYTEYITGPGLVVENLAIANISGQIRDSIRYKFNIKRGGNSSIDLEYALSLESAVTLR